jgi:hypothetical protein
VNKDKGTCFLFFSIVSSTTGTVCMYLVIVKDPELQYLPLTLLERPLSKVYVMIMLGYNLDLSRGESKL